MNIYANVGAKVVYSIPDNGTECDKEECGKYLELNKIYTVDFMDNRSSTNYVYLQELHGIGFNAVMFEDGDKDIVNKKWTLEEDILLWDNYPHIDIAVLAKFLGRSEEAIKVRANTFLGLRRKVKKLTPEKYNKEYSKIKSSKHYKECLTEDQAARMGIFLSLLCRVKRVADRIGRESEIDLGQMRESFRLALG